MSKYIGVLNDSIIDIFISNTPIQYPDTVDGEKVHCIEVDESLDYKIGDTYDPNNPPEVYKEETVITKEDMILANLDYLVMLNS